MSHPKNASTNQFPSSFLWGAATAAHQVEGSQHNDWSVWEPSVAESLAAQAEYRLKLTVPDWPLIAGEASDPANYISGKAADHYNRYPEDFDILHRLGCNAYRFSIEWSRVEPEPGQYDQAALDHYAAVVRALRQRGITPLVTLHHFTNPVWLEAHGGWHGNEVVGRFAKFTEVMVQAVGSQVAYWNTVNEPGSYLLMRYLGGGAWPAWPHMAMNPPQGYAYVRNVLKAHRAARNAIRAANPEAQVGIALALVDFHLARRDPLSWLFKKQLDYFPDTYLLNRLKADADFIGVNYYLRMPVKTGLNNPQQWAQKWDGMSPRNDMGWGICPDGIYSVTQRLRRYGLPLIITENGIPDATDAQRATYLRDTIAALARSRADGADIRGYFYWSLLDNYEWSEGYWPKFGLVAVDRVTQKRTLRPSAHEYARLIGDYTETAAR